MSSYTFDNLSPIDFEELCRDLLQKELHITFESFTEGKDGGIDFRSSPSLDNDSILQCKRFTKSNFSSLKTELKKEFENVKKLNPKRYILMTSFGLTPANEEMILKIFHPYIQKSEDIYGKNDINNLIGKYSEIEKKHYKLWIESSNILEKFIHKDVINRSNFKFDEIKEKLKIFVMSENYNDAVEILNEYHYCIIAGNPGVGKSTLADVLSYSYVREEFEFCYVLQNISEALEVFEDGKKQVFYFDDFLGANFLEDGLERNEESDFISFIRKIGASNNKKLILTTREYILTQAKARYEKLKNSDIDIVKCTIDMSKYSKRIKAKILYNHLFYSKLPEEYFENILSDKGYKKIIAHANYNPRLIEYLTDKNKIASSDILSSNYTGYFLKILDNPEKIWEGAFNKISSHSQYLLYTLSLAYNKIFMDDLEKAFLSIYESEAKARNFEVNINAFKNALKELEGNFIKIEYDGKNHIVSFQNPSIKDFLIGVVQQNTKLIEMLLDNIVYFDHFFNLFTYETLYYYNKVKIDERLLNLFSSRVKENFSMPKACIIKYSNVDYYQYCSRHTIDRLNSMYTFFATKKTDLLIEFIKQKMHDIKDEIFTDYYGFHRITYIRLFIALELHNVSSNKELFEYFKENIHSEYDLKCLSLLDENILEFRPYFDSNKSIFVSSVENYLDDEVNNIGKDNDGSNSVNELENFNNTFDANVNLETLNDKIDELNNYLESEADMQLEESRFERDNIEDEENYIDYMFETLQNSKE